MCLATPAKVIKISGRWAIIETSKHRHRVDISLLKNVRMGDYLLAHGNLAINKLPQVEARKILKLIEKEG